MLSQLHPATSQPPKCQMSAPSTAVETLDPEKQFVQTYVQLMGLSENSPPSQFYSTHDYDKLQSLGPSLPKFTYKFPTSVGNKAEGKSTVKLKFKSIKPPYKISYEFDASTTSTIYKIKSRLINDVDNLTSAGITPKDVKLMLKSKVVQDTSTLTTLVGENTELSFNCIITPPTSKQVNTMPSKAEEEPEPEPAIPTTLSTAALEQIQKIIKQDIVDPAKAEEIFQKFKNSV
ncbi:hypothetical protein CORT_0E05610 [Candida orthopsilosis Co 90-125]|uniref:Ubiquitin-like domain-containing protein n=1 Tax=Candida orthopsilosis (strain 90-125) TaxID=1136231 RepID=H8X847_CANO9|nr:hypothetical protein CORT_0E05610 [Candida orthopsilosis Co 90-125]CCG24146.1 hypothetical protein CORT_0E05610 [Candida orthopsilosis Co 90-125]